MQCNKLRCTNPIERGKRNLLYSLSHCWIGQKDIQQSFWKGGQNIFAKVLILQSSWVGSDFMIKKIQMTVEIRQ